MWYPTTIADPAVEPVTSAQAKMQLRIEAADTDFDTELTRLIAVARAHVEAYCGARFASREATMLCDSFADLARLPEAPVSAVTSIAYVDADGASQTLAASVYELRGDGLEAAIVLKYGQAWPSIRPGSRITVTATVGAAPADDVLHAMLLHIADMFHRRETEARAGFTTADALLCNHRRNA